MFFFFKKKKNSKHLIVFENDHRGTWTQAELMIRTRSGARRIRHVPRLL